MKSALITGITGQDGSYLSELLLAKGYHVHGIVRRSSSFNTARIDHLYSDPHEASQRLTLHYGDLTDSSVLRRVIEQSCPDEIYNLGAQSHVKVSFELPEYTADADAVGTLRLLEAVRDHVQHTGRKVHFYQAGSSEMFGAAKPPQNESNRRFIRAAPMLSPKCAAHWYGINYREAYGLFVTQRHSVQPRIAAARRNVRHAQDHARAGADQAGAAEQKLFLGNLDAKRDWGFAGDYVEAMWMMLQHDEPDDYVVATGETHSVREFLDEAAVVPEYDWQKHVEIDPRYFRPTEVDYLLGDSTKVQSALGWKPKTRLNSLSA